MVKAQVGVGKLPPVALGKASNFPQLSSTMFKSSLHTFEVIANAGASNLMQAYASSMWMNDFLHSAGLITDQTYQDVRLLSDIVDITTIGTDVFGSLFGNGALTPQLKTRVETNNEVSDSGGGGNDIAQALTAANIQALASLISEVDTTVG